MSNDSNDSNASSARPYWLTIGIALVLAIVEGFFLTGGQRGG
jgi:hypothetical protein